MRGQISKPIAAGIDTSRPAEERYDIVGRIATGGMAEIYLARMKSTSGAAREVVLKRLLPELQSDHEFVQMFFDEASIASKMRHPNVVQIYELGELDGSLFISMELLRGANLRDLLARLHARGEGLSVPLGVRIACGCLDALSYAHRFTDENGRLLNVVHRDVSPQNIIVTYDGTVKLVDFGVAKAEGRLHQTRAGLVKGKFAYMSPEQVGGGHVDGRSDLFALAEVLYEVLLQRHPFYAPSDMEVLRAILDKDPPHPANVSASFPPALGSILMRALKKAPGARFPDAATMHDELEQFLQDSRTPATTVALGKFVRELFGDRVNQEHAARQEGDDDALIEAMQVGRADLHPPRRRRSPSAGGGRAMVVRDETAEDPMPHHESGVRDRIVEVSRAIGTPVDPAEQGPPGFLAHSGYRDASAVRQRFSSQVRGLFDSDVEDPSDRPTSPDGITNEDSGELPTVMGALSEADLQRIRIAAKEAKRRAQDRAPTARRLQPKENKAAAASARSSGSGASLGRAGMPQVPEAVTHRSQTVVHRERKKAGGRADRWSLLFFLAGLGALIGAIVYAVLLYAGTQQSSMRLVISSQPPGAAIVLDGKNTGVRTPQTFQSIAADRPHTVELILEGYPPYRRSIPASKSTGELIIDWRFKKAPQ